MNWLDTQTQELLQAEPPGKIAPAKVAEYGLVLLKKGIDHHRLVRAVSRINDCSGSVAEALLRRPLPVTINPDLEFGDAQLGQFELVCCDAVTAIVSSEVLEQGDKDYLNSLFERVSESAEFKPCPLTIIDLPPSEDGRKFADQFLGSEPDHLQGVRVDVPFKKARIMKHWADRIGARVDCDAIRK